MLRVVIILSLICATGVLPGEAQADGIIASPEADWPQWRGRHRNGITDEKGLLAAWPKEGPALRYCLERLGRGWAAPIIAGGLLYVTGDREEKLTVFAFDLDGKPKWKTTNGAVWRSPWPGARSSPTYSEGVLYLINGHGRLAAIEAATGKERWAANVLERFEARNGTWGISESLLVDGPRVYVTPASPKALMVALDKKTGKTIWTSEPLEKEQVSYCSPILFRYAGRRILSNCTSHHAFGVDADSGKILWKVPVHGRWSVTCSTPVYEDGRIFYVTCDGPNGSQHRIHVDENGVRSELAWRTQVDTLTGSGILVDGRLFTNGSKKHKSLYCLDWETGKTLYSTKVTQAWSKWASAAMVWAEGRLYAFFENGTLALFVPGEKDFGVRGNFRVVQTSPTRNDAWGHPILHNGRLYVRYHDRLWCYDAAKP
jgi:outer membrane protein assembly factor BamB